MIEHMILFSAPSAKQICVIIIHYIKSRMTAKHWKVEAAEACHQAVPLPRLANISFPQDEPWGCRLF